MRLGINYPNRVILFKNVKLSYNCSKYKITKFS